MAALRLGLSSDAGKIVVAFSVGLGALGDGIFLVPSLTFPGSR